MGQNIFHIACSNGWDDFVRLLVKKPPKIKVTHRKSLKIDFKAKEKYDRKISKIDFKAKDKYNETGFILACKHGWNDIVEYLLSVERIFVPALIYLPLQSFYSVVCLSNSIGQIVAG